MRIVFTREMGRKFEVKELSSFLSNGEIVMAHHEDGTLPVERQSWNRVQMRVNINAKPGFHISFGMRSFPAAVLDLSLLSASLISKTLISASRMGSSAASVGKSTNVGEYSLSVVKTEMYCSNHFALEMVFEEADDGDNELKAD